MLKRFLHLALAAGLFCLARPSSVAAQSAGAPYDAAFIERQQNLWVAILVLAILLTMVIFFVVRENFRRADQSVSPLPDLDGQTDELTFKVRRMWVVSVAVLGAAAFAFVQAFNADEGLLVGAAALVLVAAITNPLTSRFFAIASNYPKTAMAHAALIAIFLASVAVEFWPVGGSSAEAVTEAAPEVLTYAEAVTETAIEVTTYAADAAADAAIAPAAEGALPDIVAPTAPTGDDVGRHIFEAGCAITGSLVRDVEDLRKKLGPDFSVDEAWSIFVRASNYPIEKIEEERRLAEECNATLGTNYYVPSSDDLN